MRAFDITRTDGRSNAQVVMDFVRNGEPGRVYTYAEIGEALSDGASKRFGVASVRGVVAAVYSRLLREQQRALHNVRGVGYRLAYAKEHTSLAMSRRRRADVQLRRGLETLRNVRWEELDENARRAHEGTLMVTEALFANQMALERRQRSVEAAIAGLTQKVSDLSGRS